MVLIDEASRASWSLRRGDPHTGYRCPGEPFIVALPRVLSLRLARLEYDVPDQDLAISYAASRHAALWLHRHSPTQVVPEGAA